MIHVNSKSNRICISQELLLAEKWARMNKLPFPKIDPKVFDREGLKECYVFKPKSGEKNCPTVIHFVLVNINFRKFKAPGKYDCMWRLCGGKISLLWHMRHLFVKAGLGEIDHIQSAARC